MTSPSKPAPGRRRNLLITALLSTALAFSLNCGGDDDDNGGGSGTSGSSGGGTGGGSNGGGTGGGSNNGSGGSGTGGSSPDPGEPSPAGVWTLGQSLIKTWDSGDSAWQGGNTIAFDRVEEGATLVLCAYGYTYPSLAFAMPSDSTGQPIEIAVDAGTERYVQATAWVLHNAKAGAHTWTNVPDLTTGDGKMFFAEFRHGRAPSTEILGAATQTLDAYEPPWLSEGSVTMSSGANKGDLLVAFSFEEESGTGSENTRYTDPPEGWTSLGVQNQTEINIGGQASWRLAPDDSPQTVSWSWTITGGQDPSLFKAAIFAVHAPLC
jgi:hypothetical protein